MTAVPAYLQKARAARATTELGPQPPNTARERSEESEISGRFQPGRRYQVKGPVVGVIHRTPPDLESWRNAMGLPRAGLMTIEGELVLVADVRATVRTGWVDVIGVPLGGSS